jgi:hypothetical protein
MQLGAVIIAGRLFWRNIHCEREIRSIRGFGIEQT